ncbi:50S ribosomal protein L29 [Pradoshia eiseniae]|uniref:50S ribosomal protein L29 n=1 Tax=Pradoshia eiseniae TaxID=2064768 RepID=A0A2S7MVA2_9BACI|nr:MULTISPECIES: hypothetical protein [Bacillaceae]KMY45786.1 50S ribosomal protein L29 [Bacillus sp. FJAT-27916]PQD93685.1 50S ribosomal protein L29 [Pradoshia eiseniae]
MKDKEIVLGLSRFEKKLYFWVPMVLGGMLGWFIPVISDLLLKLPVVPWGGIIEFIASLNSLWFSIVASIIGIIVGIIWTLIIYNESLEIKINFENLQLKIDDKIDTIDKKDISAIYIDYNQLVILGESSNQLYREVLDAKKETAQEAFNLFQYPWCEKDPYEGQYQRWVLGHPDFPEKINALLYAREITLREGKKKEAKYLQMDLAKLGVVIKDENNAQYVRLAKGIN